MPRRSRSNDAIEKGDDIGYKTRRAVIGIGAALLIVAGFVGNVVPFLLSFLLDGIGVVALFASGALIALAAWMRRNSDDPRERLGWFLALLVAGSLLVLYQFG